MVTVSFFQNVWTSRMLLIVYFLEQNLWMQHCSAANSDISHLGVFCQYKNAPQVFFKIQDLYCHMHNKAVIGNEILKSQAPSNNAQKSSGVKWQQY